MVGDNAFHGHLHSHSQVCPQSLINRGNGIMLGSNNFTNLVKRMTELLNVSSTATIKILLRLPIYDEVRVSNGSFTIK